MYHVVRHLQSVDMHLQQAICRCIPCHVHVLLASSLDIAAASWYQIMCIVVQQLASHKSYVSANTVA